MIPRWLLRLAAPAALIGVVSFSGMIVLGQPDPPPSYAQTATPRRSVAQRLALSRTQVAAAFNVTMHFVASAVVRHHVERSYELVSPELRRGYTRARWARGTIPVVPFVGPWDSARVRFWFRLERDSTPRKLWAIVRLVAPTGESQDFRVALVPARGRVPWLVSYWAPAVEAGGGGGLLADP
jgi:hypothetical protein